MLQNILLTTLTPLAARTEINSWENQPFTLRWPEQNQQNVKEVTKTIQKTKKRVRTAFSTDQVLALETTFSRHKYITSEKRKELAKTLKINEKCIKVWFQNRRMKEKKESSESSSDSSNESHPSYAVSTTTTAPIQTREDDCISGNMNHNYNHYNTEYCYQLPPYYAINQAFENTMLMRTHYASPFSNDSNTYPTQYYPPNMNYINEEGNVFKSNYENEMNQYWASDQNVCYTPQ